MSGAQICLVGVALIMYATRGATDCVVAAWRTSLTSTLVNQSRGTPSTLCPNHGGA